MTDTKAEYVFEVSWEVCNFAGGINTVIKTKAPQMMMYYNNFFFIGPYFKDKADFEFKEEAAPDYIAKAMREMENEGVRCHYGKWQIRGEANAILLDFGGLFSKKDYIKTKMWDDFRVDSLGSPGDFDEPVVWAWAAGMLIQKIANNLGGKKIICHAHEWLSGAAILCLKSNKMKVGTVFTTHATMLARSLAGSGFPLYEELGKFDPMQKAKESGIMAKHTMEVACANNADVFTTVSEITSMEAEKLLGKKADVILFNGIDLEKYPTIEETSIKHVTCREIIREFLTYHFFPYYTFDLRHNLLFFFASRYEFSNKGMDIFAKALGMLNERLKKESTPRTVTVFFWVPMRAHGIKVELLENKNYYRHIKSLVDEKSTHILQQIVKDFISRNTALNDSFFEKDFMKELKGNILTFQRAGNPPMVTHNIENEQADALVRALLNEGLDNRQDDRVKVIVYPVFVSGNDGLLNLSYYDAMAGCHLGIFPSYYEPWGYTPLEAAAMGVASLTSDLSGFGRYINDHLPREDPGIFILKRHNRSKEQATQDLADSLYNYSLMHHAQRVQNKINAKYISNICDWKLFVKYYLVAHNKALEKHGF